MRIGYSAGRFGAGLLGVVLAAACATSNGTVAGGSAPVASAPAAATTTASTTADATASTGTGTAQAGVARCTTSVLRAALADTEGAAGSVVGDLVFTNTGPRPCELRGFPGVSYVTGDAGTQVGPAAEMVGERGPQVVLAPGGTAAAPVQLVQVANFDAAVCRPEPVRGLRVYPPGDTTSLFVPAPGTGCAGTPPGPQLTVRTVAAR
jgi:hypothetical protein